MAERGRDVRQRLLAAAVELIAQKGWSAVSTRILAERAGVAPGVVHYHFSSLQALLTEAAVGAMRAAVAGLEPAEDLVAGLIDPLENFTGDDPVSLVFVETYLAATRDAELREAIGALVIEFQQKLAGWLAERAVDQPQETATVLVAAIDGLMLHRALNPSAKADLRPVLRRLLG
ncbi:TetR/AcrR family transcriptional regulator [Kibdelosporangium philippinense]|uniref:TetR/AcrR family transcriptional regulator n=1 Tax=Kibdelosporangium philippinense TaxID=211113 RepID=A0ABS8Z9V5_9PSEU|nr:TetR/AcrR family transcriptional regulator [Kibdelosporangium philippinense]MCE7002637.1 TetR/AcrR family transcriptional regulator [Kibdelosporangium philippinense]